MRDFRAGLFGGFAQVTRQSVSRQLAVPIHCEVVRDQVVPVLALLETTECHLCPGDVLLGIL